MSPLVLALACGRDPQLTDPDPTDTPDETGTAPGACVPEGAPEAPLRKLTNRELDATLADLLGVEGTARARLPPDPTVHGFENAAASVAVSQLAADGYLRVAEDATAAADWSALLPCDPATGDRACAEAFVDGFGRRAFRRPLLDEERSIFLDLYDAMVGVEGFEGAVALVVQAMLQSPQALYRVELGQPGATGASVPLTDHELATRLSYFLWGTTPDEELLAAADAGQLADPAVLAAQVDRLLADPRAREAVGHFVEQWLGTLGLEDEPKAATSYPEWSPELAADLREELRRFAAHVVFEEEGTLEGLLTSRAALVNGRVAGVYGVPAPADPDAWTAVELPADERAGLLTRAAVLADAAHLDQTSIVLRGKLVYEQLFCLVQPDPPGDLDISLPPLDDDLSTRERFARHTQDPACAGCHLNMDPVGLGLEHYDAIGRFRTTEGDDVPVDATGRLHYGSAAGPFYGGIELSERLATAPEVGDCLVTQVFRDAFGRDPGPADACDVEALRAAAGGDVLDLLSAIPATDGFRHRPRVTP